MIEILHTYTIQWVGPFKSYNELRDYCKKGRKEVYAHPSLFSFYYFRGNKKWKRERTFCYFGKHGVSDTITHRLNRSHEHFRNFHENENLEIWIGSFANPDDQANDNIDYVETIFIKRYSIWLNDNVCKKAKPFVDIIDKSFVIVNLWYDTNEKPYRGRQIVPFEDIITYETDEKRLLAGTLRRKKIIE